MSRFSMCSVAFVFGAVLLNMPVAIAGSLDGLSQAQIAALSPLLSAYSAGSLCNFLIKPDAAAAFLDKKIGASTRYTNLDIAGIVFLYVGQQGMQKAMGALPTDAKSKKNYCASMLSAFGKNGTQISGILEE